MAELIPFREEINALEEARWRLESLDPEAAASRLSRLPDQVKQLRERIEKGRKAARTGEEGHAGEARPPRRLPSPEKRRPAPLKVAAPLALRTAQAVESLRRSLRTWFTFYDGFTPDFSWWVRKPHEAADKALEDYAKFLREEIAGQHGKDEDPLVGDPVGEQGLKRLLAGELIAYTPQEIVKIGERELDWCEAEMRKAAGEMGFSENWKAALAKVKSSFVPPGQQDELIAQQARETIRFVKEHDLLTVPPLCEETWRLTMTSPEQQKFMPYAAYGGQQMTVAYASESMKHEDKLMAMRGNNRHFTRIVTAHELIPGHHLERYQSNRHRTYRGLFSTPFFVEGWGLYWELRLWDLKFATSPEDRIGMLFWRMNRSARIIVSFRFHLGTMTPAEMVDFLVDRVGNERFGATSEVRRYLQYPPLYQAAYMLGGLQHYALHREAVGSGRMTEKAYHDAVLSVPLDPPRDGPGRAARPAPLARLPAALAIRRLPARPTLSEPESSPRSRSPGQLMSDPSNPWTTLSRRLVYENPWIRVREDQVLRPDGQPGIYGVVEFKNRAVGVLPVDDEGHVWLVGQYRYPLDLYSWEIPEGGSPERESPEETARRELQEETGLVAGRLELIGTAHLSNSVCDEVAYIYRATELVTRSQHARGDREAARQADELGGGLGHASPRRDHRLDVRDRPASRGREPAGEAVTGRRVRRNETRLRAGRRWLRDASFGRRGRSVGSRAGLRATRQEVGTAGARGEGRSVSGKTRAMTDWVGK